MRILNFGSLNIDHVYRVDNIVQPGETKDVVIPLDPQGSAKLPVWPATSGVTGKANYMIDIPQLTVN